MKNLMLAAVSLAALVPGAANAAVFTLSAAGTDAQNGSSIAYQGTVTTGDATSGADGDVYQILGASGTATLDGTVDTINGAFGSFTLSGGAIVSMQAFFRLDDFMGGMIQKSAGDQSVGISESSGPATSLSLTPQVSAVPEPGSWAVMTIGIGAMALGLRQRRARVRFA